MSGALEDRISKSPALIKIIGDGNMGSSSPTRIIPDFLHGHIPAYIDAVSTFMDVEDVAQGHLLMAEKDRRGRRYILAGPEHVTAKEFLGFLAEISGSLPPRIKMPAWVDDVAARLIQWIADYVTRKYPLMIIRNAILLHEDTAADIGKARQELEYSPGDWKAAVIRAVKWSVEHDYNKIPKLSSIYQQKRGHRPLYLNIENFRWRCKIE